MSMQTKFCKSLQEEISNVYQGLTCRSQHHHRLVNCKRLKAKLWATHLMSFPTAPNSMQVFSPREKSRQFFQVLFGWGGGSEKHCVLDSAAS